MVLTVIGEIVAIQSWALWLLLPLTLIYLEVLVGSWEERDLVAKHGKHYLVYKQGVTLKRKKSASGQQRGVVVD